jgi:hypothetical protein
VFNLLRLGQSQGSNRRSHVNNFFIFIQLHPIVKEDAHFKRNPAMTLKPTFMMEDAQIPGILPVIRACIPPGRSGLMASQSLHGTDL